MSLGKWWSDVWHSRRVGLTPAVFGKPRNRQELRPGVSVAMYDIPDVRLRHHPGWKRRSPLIRSGCMELLYGSELPIRGLRARRQRLQATARRRRGAAAAEGLRRHSVPG